MKKIAFILVLAYAHQSYAGIYDFFTQFSLINKASSSVSEISALHWKTIIGLGFTGVAAYFAKNKIGKQEHQRTIIRKELLSIAEDALKIEQDIKKSFIEQSVAQLPDQLNTSEISPEFFLTDKPRTDRPRIYENNNIFNIPEVNFLLKNLDERKKDFNQSGETSEKEHQRAIEDIRELKHLGQLSENNAVNKHYISFRGLLNSTGRETIRISFIERKPATKTMINKKTNEPEEVPCMKKLAKTILVGTETSSGSFAWQKISNTNIQSSEETLLEYKPSKVRFDDVIKVLEFTQVNPEDID